MYVVGITWPCSPTSIYLMSLLLPALYSPHTNITYISFQVLLFSQPHVLCPCCLLSSGVSYLAPEHLCLSPIGFPYYLLTYYTSSQHSKHVFVVANSFPFLEFYWDIIHTPYSLPTEGIEFDAFQHNHRAVQPSPQCKFRIFFITTKHTHTPMPINGHFLFLPDPSSLRQPLFYFLNL